LYETLVGNDVDVAEPIDIDTLDSGSLKDVFNEHNSLIVGTPTWNTNADTFRSGTGWDDLYYDKLPDLKSILEGKKVAVFGLGDQISYGENYADATGELYSVFESLGCDMVPYAHTSQDGYDHVTSKSILPDSDLFCGLLLDQINQDDLTDNRISNWIENLQVGGFFDADGSISVPKTVATNPIEVEQDDDDDDDDELVTVETSIKSEIKQAVLERSPATTSNYIPHYNSKTGRTMWTSPDGRSSYVTTESKSVLSP
jgi:flavodoxin I